MTSQLTLSSYNSTGFGPGKPEYIADLVKLSDFVLLQEHWLRKSQFHRIKNIPCDKNINILSHDVSAIDDNIFINGRGYGGCSIIWKSTLNGKVMPIIMNSNRICAVQVSLQSVTVLIFNVYMPCDVRSNDNELVEIYGEIISKCNEMDCSNFIIGGDLNTCMKRTDSFFTKHLHYICDTEYMKPCSNFNNQNIKYTFTSPVDHGTHVIDHFLVNNGLFNYITEYTSIHNGANLSFHSPILVKFMFNVEYFKHAPREYASKPKWQEANDQELYNYGVALDDNLDAISIPWDAMRCADMKCTDHSLHCHDIQVFHDMLMESCISACEANIPYTSCSKNNNCRNIAGWNNYVKPYKEASLFWHNVWKDCGAPRNAVVADVMRRARAKYHQAVKYVKQNQDSIKKENMANALLSNNKRDFWKEIKKINKNNNCLPNLIDDVTGNQDISNHFSSKYESLYNSVSYNEADMKSLMKRFDCIIDNFEIDINGKSNSVITVNMVNDVVEGISQVKHNKKDGYGVVYTDHFINATHKMFVYLSLLFNAMVFHGFSPDGFSIATIQPLIKDKRKSINNSDNYRAIALSSPLAKVFDWIILNKQSSVFETCDLQFGFKAKSSTSKCSFALMETINYFQSNNSEVYVLLLDATRAFDRVNYVKLFQLLIDRGLNPLVIRCLLYMYTNQHLNVSWNNHMSNYFDSSNGVKQGGVLSPILFAIYIDELLTRLKCSGYGCMIGHIYCGAFGYMLMICQLLLPLFMH